MRKIVPIMLAALCAVSVGYTEESYSLQIVNNTTDKVFKHCRVSPNGDGYLDDVPRAITRYSRDYLHISNVNRDFNSRVRSMYKDTLQGDGYDSEHRFSSTCGISRTEVCNGFNYTNNHQGVRVNSLLHLDLYALSTGLPVGNNWSDFDNSLFHYELLSRNSVAYYQFPNKINYRGWSVYNASITSGGSFIQGINNLPPLLQLECDLYGSSDNYLSTFGFILRKDQTYPQFFKGGDEHLDSGQVQKSGSLITYKIDYKM